MASGGKIAAASGAAIMIAWLSFLSTRPQTDQCMSETDAMYAAQSLVKQRLASPSTVKFPSPTWEYTIIDLGECKHRVAGYFDAQNRFGAIIRARFVAEVYYSKEEKHWYPEDVSIIE